VGRLCGWFVLLGLIGCFKPRYPEGLACGGGADPCPPGMTCGPDGRCRSQPGDPDGPGADATVDADPADAFVCTAPVTNTIDLHIERGVQFAGGPSLEIVVPDGHRIHGTVTIDGGLPPQASFNFGEVTLQGATALEFFLYRTFTVGPSGSFEYDIVVPPGSYQLVARTSFIVDDLVTGQLSSLTSRARRTAAVCGDTTFDVTVPSLAAVRSVNVTVQGFENLPAFQQTSYSSLRVSLANEDLEAAIQETGIGVDPFMQPLVLSVPPIPLIPTVTVSQELPNLPDFVAAAILPEAAPATSDLLDVPPLSMLSGTAFDPGGHLSYGVGSSVSCLPVADPEADSRGWLKGVDSSYRTFVPTGSSCVIVGSYTIHFGDDPDGGPPAAGGTLVDPAIPGAPVTFTGDRTHDITVPMIGSPDFVRVTVLDARNDPVRGVRVSAVTEPASGPLAGTRFTPAGDLTDLQGEADLQIPSGTYDIRIERITF
jgi:hypothetical protein